MVDEQEFFLAVNALKDIAYTDNHLSALVKFLIFALKNFGYSLELSGCFNCQTDIKGRTFFDYRNGAFLCEDCIEEGCREINGITLLALQKAEKNELDDNHQGTKKALKLLEYYILNRAEESLNSLSELNKICL